MKKILVVLSLMAFTGTFAATSYAASNGIQIELKKDDDKKKKKKKKKKGSCDAKKAETKSCCSKKK